MILFPLMATGAVQFRSSVQRLKRLLQLFDADSLAEKKSLLHLLLKSRTKDPDQIAACYGLVLWMLAYPSGKAELDLVKRVLRYLARLLKQISPAGQEKLVNTGLPFTPLRCALSPDLLRMLPFYGVNCVYDSQDADGVHPQEVFGHFLSPAENEALQMRSLSAEQYLETVFGSGPNRINRMLEHLFSSGLPYSVRDEFWNRLNVYPEIRLNEQQSQGFLSAPVTQWFFNSGIQKKADMPAMCDAPLPDAALLSEEQRHDLLKVMRLALLGLRRETDPVTYADENSLEYYELDRGISVALIGAVPERRQAYESYIGYMAFRNGIPVSYGGAWLFGKRALFGINIFEAFRGGESAQIFCSLISLYHRRYQASHFEVEPYQYGADNPEGIKSGAFWFYYRLGFRPKDKKIAALAARKWSKILSDKKYKTPVNILKKFTESRIFIDIHKNDLLPPDPLTLGEGILNFTAKKYRSDRKPAIVESTLWAMEANGLSDLDFLTPEGRRSFENWSLLAASLKDNVIRERLLPSIPALAQAKAGDESQAQTLLLEVFG